MQIPTQIEERFRALGLNVQEVEERFVRRTGPGGQKINKTSSTVWLRHGPSRIEVKCQAGRSQLANRETAWNELCGKLEGQQDQKKQAAKQDREKQRRRVRQKSPRQKARMVDGKKHRAKHKAKRGRVRGED